MAEQSATVLIVEDDHDYALALSVRLRSEGYAVNLAQDAYQATRCLRDDMPDLIIMDYRIPAGDGLRVQERLRDIAKREVPVIFVTGDGSREVEVKARSLGAVAVFRKPVNSQQLVSTIQRCLAPRNAEVVTVAS